MTDSFIRREQDFEWGERFIFNGKTSWQKVINKGIDGTPQIFLVKQDLGPQIPEFSHGQDEVLYILDGELSLSHRTCSAGTVLFVKAYTVNGPTKAGPPVGLK